MTEPATVHVDTCTRPYGHDGDCRHGITDPGVYDMAAEDYHADPVAGGSLSSTGARQLLPPSCPALFHYARLHPEAPRKTFDIGSAAHKLVLGSGPELVLVDRARWDTNAVKAELKDIRERGAIPLKRGEYEQVHAMAAALREHPAAAALFDPERGQPERTLIWPDLISGVMQRARLDWLPQARDGRMIVPDYKTTVDADPTACAKTIANLGYHVQAAFYLDGVTTLGAEDAVFVFVMQEKTPPYLVTVVEPDPDALMWGRVLIDRALDVYRRCTESGRWPGYADDVVLAELPRWQINQYEAARDRGDLDITPRTREDVHA